MSDLFKQLANDLRPDFCRATESDPWTKIIPEDVGPFLGPEDYEHGRVVYYGIRRSPMTLTGEATHMDQPAWQVSYQTPEGQEFTGMFYISDGFHATDHAPVYVDPRTIALSRTLRNPLRCLYCESEDLATGQLEQTSALEVFQDIECNHCGSEWRDLYTLSKVDCLEQSDKAKAKRWNLSR